MERRTNKEAMIVWQDLNLRRYFVWICQGYLVNLVKQRVFQLTSLMSMVSKFINVDFMVVKILISMALEIEQTEEVTINQVIQMRKRLKVLQV